MIFIVIWCKAYLANFNLSASCYTDWKLLSREGNFCLNFNKCLDGKQNLILWMLSLGYLPKLHRIFSHTNEFPTKKYVKPSQESNQDSKKEKYTRMS